jgi:hypothetical protein
VQGNNTANTVEIDGGEEVHATTRTTIVPTKQAREREREEKRETQRHRDTHTHTHTHIHRIYLQLHNSVHEKFMTALRILIVPLQWKWQARHRET